MRFGTCGGRTSSRLPSRACLRTLPSRPCEERGARPHAGLSAAALTGDARVRQDLIRPKNSYALEGFMGSRRAANARNRAYAIVRKSAAREPQTRINRAIARESSRIVVSLEQACHAGGRGFESRRSRKKSLHKRAFCCRARERHRALGQQTIKSGRAWSRPSGRSRSGPARIVMLARSNGSRGCGRHFDLRRVIGRDRRELF
jgi:hypothetical protein